jgi:hypothetical protein
MFRALLLLALAWPVCAATNQLLVCGWDTVYILDLDRNKENPPVVWSWTAASSPGLPEAYKNKFRTTDDCKQVEGGRILITASSDGIALVDRATKRTLFYGLCANAHSAELLPGNRLAVACSVRAQGGNRLAVFDAAVPEKELYSTELYSGHGAVWDGSRQLLWALSGQDLRAYSLRNWATNSPSLQLEASYPLDSRGGHELLAVPHSNLLALTSVQQVYLFDRDARTYSKHPDLKDQPDIKSLSYRDSAGPIAYTRADRPNWWTETIRFLHPASTLVRSGEKIYKVRWVH